MSRLLLMALALLGLGMPSAESAWRDSLRARDARMHAHLDAMEAATDARLARYHYEAAAAEALDDDERAALYSP